jgi:succinyl-CoA synthetase beta subunit
VHIVTRSQQSFDVASKMLGQHLITKQTGAEGRRCDKVFVVERLYLRREMYLSIMLDRSVAGPLLIASSRGGTSIEDVAATTPSLIFKMPIDLRVGITPEQVDRVVEALQLSERASQEGKTTINNLWRMFASTDATMIEVNPLAETPDGKVVVADAKINFDDNAAFRQPDIFKHRDFSQEDPREVRPRFACLASLRSV